MSCVGLLLAKLGFSVKTWLKKAFILPDLAQFRPEEKPPYAKKRGVGKRKLLLLGLGAALAIANSVPRVETGKTRALRLKLRQFKAKGILRTKKIKGQLLEDLRALLSKLPSELLHEGQVIPVICDTSCSRTSSGFVDDFQPGSLVPLETPIQMDGVAGTLHATHIGRMQFECLNDHDRLTTVETYRLLVPNIGCCLLSPRICLRSLRNKEEGKASSF